MAAAYINHEEKEAAQAEVEIWKYMFGFTEMAILKCAIELKIPDILENHEAMALAQLSSAIGSNSPSAVYRMMRFLTHRGIFKEVKTQEESQVSYSQTALSRLLMRDKMAPSVLLHCHPLTVNPWHGLSKVVLAKEDGKGGFEGEHGKDIWQSTAVDPSYSKLFNDAMACSAHMNVTKAVESYPKTFEGIGSLVDVGGGNGTALRILVKAFPSIRGITFDLPHVVSSAPPSDGVEYVGGDFFDKVPNADAAFLMGVLHDWDDDACAKILKNCKDAIPKDTGKVIIMDIVVDEVEGNRYRDAHLTLDIIMMSHTVRGKERTSEEWGHIISAAGYTKHTIKRIPALLSIIEAYP